MILPFQTPDEVTAAIPRVQAHLLAGRVLGYPTETVYGLGSLPTEGAVRLLSSVKGRVKNKPFLLIVSSRAMAESYGLYFTEAADALAKTFWPGPLTLVLRGGEGRVSELLRGPEGGIAVRHTSHPGIARLVEAIGQPLTSTSANRPGDAPAPGAARLVELFRAEVDNGDVLVLDGGVLGNVPPSTLVDCTGPAPKVVREGAISRAEIRRAIGGRRA
jgi:L-threonylcarbamoyladenylate synthase